MRPVYITRELATDDPNGICESQKPLAAGALTLDGILVSGGVAQLDVQRRVLITSDADDSPNTFTITGTDDQGRAISETVTGPATPAVVYTDLDFYTVTEVTISAAAVGNIIVGTNTIGSSKPIPLDIYLDPFSVTLEALIDAASTVDGTVQWTNDDIWNSFGPFTWTAVSAGLTGFTASAYDTLVAPVRAVRLLTNSGTDPIELSVIQAGAKG